MIAHSSLVRVSAGCLVAPPCVWRAVPAAAFKRRGRPRRLAVKGGSGKFWPSAAAPEDGQELSRPLMVRCVREARGHETAPSVAARRLVRGAGWSRVFCCLGCRWLFAYWGLWPRWSFRRGWFRPSTRFGSASGSAAGGCSSGRTSAMSACWVRSCGSPWVRCRRCPGVPVTGPRCGRRVGWHCAWPPVCRARRSMTGVGSAWWRGRRCVLIGSSPTGVADAVLVARGAGGLADLYRLAPRGGGPAVPSAPARTRLAAAHRGVAGR
jgi:hypothetical protein